MTAVTAIHQRREKAVASVGAIAAVSGSARHWPARKVSVAAAGSLDGQDGRRGRHVRINIFKRFI